MTCPVTHPRCAYAIVISMKFTQKLTFNTVLNSRWGKISLKKCQKFSSFYLVYSKTEKQQQTNRLPLEMNTETRSEFFLCRSIRHNRITWKWFLHCVKFMAQLIYAYWKMIDSLARLAVEHKCLIKFAAV